MDLVARLRNNILLYLGTVLLSVGIFNLSTAYFVNAQEESSTTTPSSDLLDVIIERLLTEIGPLVGGAVTIAIQFARKQGLKISAEAEEYFVNAAKSFVENQSRFLYKEIRDNPQYREYLVKGRIPPELIQKAKQNVLNQLRVELQSDEFTKVARQMLEANLETLIERHVTENKKETSERIHALLSQYIPVAVDAALLNYKTYEETNENKDKIIAEALESVAKIFDSEELLFSRDNAILLIKSELNKKIGNVK